MEVKNFKATRLIVHVDQGDQHEYRSQEGVQKELYSGINPTWATPDTDDQKHRDQHRLKKDVEQNGVHRSEYPNHETLHDQESGHVLGNSILHHFPASDNYQHSHECGKQNQRHREPIHPQVVIDIEGGNPRDKLLKLHCRRRRIK